ncbi:YitT family protein [Microbacterium sp.]|uniref:membrane protein YczE n=1 Tax=Microbacterium sp. TaxID=51671 RepID=UPI0037CCC1B5
MRRLTQLMLGLILYGVGVAIVVVAGLGVDPWTVLAEGLALRTGIGLGWITNIIGLAVLILWIPLRQKPGLGTIANILVVGTALQFALPLVPSPENLLQSCALLLGGVALVGIAGGLYLGARFGPGPRDGLMTGISARWGWPLWLARTAVEITVLAIGWTLGGTVGVGTLVYALAIGPASHAALRLFDTQRPARRRTRSTDPF